MFSYIIYSITGGGGHSTGLPPATIRILPTIRVTKHPFPFRPVNSTVTHKIAANDHLHLLKHPLHLLRELLVPLALFVEVLVVEDLQQHLPTLQLEQPVQQDCPVLLVLQGSLQFPGYFLELLDSLLPVEPPVVDFSYDALERLLNDLDALAHPSQFLLGALRLHLLLGGVFRLVQWQMLRFRYFQQIVEHAVIHTG